jgi:hypothetical protein
MPLTQLAPPYPIFTDKNGDPLDAGYLYFGTANLNPETNPIQVYYDRGLTQPLAQPVRTSNGYVMRNGSPALVYADSASFSVTVRNKKNELVIYSPVGFGVVPGIPFAVFENAAKNVADLVADTQFTYNAGISGTVQVAAGDILRTLAEGFAYEVAASGATDQHVTTAGGVKLYVQALGDIMPLAAFAPAGDGVTDDTTVVQNAAAAAGAVNKRLYAPAGTYKLTAAITLTSGLVGDGSALTIFQGTDLGVASGLMMTATGGDTYEGFTADGDCSADPVSWNSGNFDAFTGWRPFFLSGVNGCVVRDVIGQNSALGAPIRIELCQDIVVENCQAIRGRGGSGDGFYTRRSRRVNFSNCRAYDVTRIGYVCEGIAGSSIEVCEQVTYLNCHAEYAHDQSINYGGTEFNSGFWFENSTLNTCTGCTTKNTGDRGFTYAGTALVGTAGFPVCQAQYINCHADTANTGFNLQSLTSTVPAVVSVDNCSSENCVEDYLSSVGKFTLTNCSSRKDGGTSQSKCIYAGTDAQVCVTNFFEHWTNQPADVTNTGTDAGSVSKFSTNHPKKIVIDNYTTYDGAAFSLKLRVATNATNVVVQNSRFASVNARFGAIDISNCIVDYATIYPQIHALASDTKFLGTLAVTDEAAGVLKRINSSEFSRSDEATFLLNLLSINDTPKPLIFVSNSNFNGNLETGENFVRVNSSSGTASSPRAHDIYVDGCALYNTGSTTANVGIELTRADGSSRAYVTSTWKSSTITNIATRTATNSTFANI